MGKQIAIQVHSIPAPPEDWICQREIARMFGISERTASKRARAGKFRRYQHGVPDAGRRKYSRKLVERDLKRRWEDAVQIQEGEFECSHS